MPNSITSRTNIIAKNPKLQNRLVLLMPTSLNFSSLNFSFADSYLSSPNSYIVLMTGSKVIALWRAPRITCRLAGLFGIFFKYATTCITFIKFHIAFNDTAIANDTTICPIVAVCAAASTATAVVSINSYSLLLGNCLGISVSITVPASMVLPVYLLMKRFSLRIVYRKMSGFVPIEILSGFLNINW